MIWRSDIHKVVLCLPDSWSNWNVEVFFKRGGNWSAWRKTSQSKGENQHRVVKSSRGCRQKLPPTWLVFAGYSAWHFFMDNFFKIKYPWTGRLLWQLSCLLQYFLTTLQQQTQPTYGVDAGIWTWATFVGGECSYHYAILAPHKAVVTAIFEICFQNNEVGFQSVSFIHAHVYWSNFTSG